MTSDGCISWPPLVHRRYNDHGFFWGAFVGETGDAADLSGESDPWLGVGNGGTRVSGSSVSGIFSAPTEPFPSDFPLNSFLSGFRPAFATCTDLSKLFTGTTGPGGSASQVAGILAAFLFLRYRIILAVGSSGVPEITGPYWLRSWGNRSAGKMNAAAPEGTQPRQISKIKRETDLKGRLTFSQPGQHRLKQLRD